jgi:uncharacterized protein YaeQ
MALQATRLVFRMRLSNVDRGVEREEAVNIARHPSETQEHVILRLLAWCLFWQDSIAFGPGLSTPDSPALWARDLVGTVTLWVDCRALDPDELKKIVHRESSAAVHLVLADRRRAEGLLTEVTAWRRPPESLSVWLVDDKLVTGLAASEARQQRWQVTFVGDHFYIDADGNTLDGDLTRLR